ncbi:hypothetical protein SAMN06265365_12313 [Tistlia consotensis]|uniref:Uncharacterized protein n=1 Tax=Tistlia consotensis USBA 355 TaxID=560819 RepID=A0A1Y6CMQ2_9PROT|nr:hypothetical protein [Tistlia consotensis]SMF64758.1 hypothetical protein SAMN05428998_12596 [Tistlia consotensis USBA 355]SNR96704.1 hypothetical protein SAMN06265365_12313 [Tistlia consotensis]
MVTEFRQIVFPMPVLRQALDSAQFSSGLACYALPPGTIVGVKLHEEVTLLIDALDGGEQADWTLSAAEIGAAMIRWCVTGGVPLPRAGDKRLSSVAGHLCLEIYLPGGVDPLPPETLGAGLPFEAGAVEIHFTE